ncbi:transcription termination factor Rho [uncultured Brachyspira sp.]|uniref:transcription termination factor Rho n=1 Tax=uncultured Brachyspira sp. TaxID=221953 RepID=UPI002627EEDF|nr:transcription termination factor Rho [uncultured Brachyspira sp.]
MPFPTKKRVKVSNENEEIETAPAQVKKVVRKRVIKQVVADSNEESTNNSEIIQEKEELDKEIETNDEVKEVKRPHDVLYITKLSCLTFEELLEFAESYGIKKDANNNIRRQELMHAILKAQIAMEGKIVAEGTLETLQDGFGFLRSQNSNYLVGPDDIYISPAQIRLFGLRTGDIIRGEVRPPKDNAGEKFFALLRIESVNGEEPNNLYKRPHFDKLTPIFPNERIDLEFLPNKISTRIINLVSPIGKGQRGLIVAPPKAGKTMMLQEIANAICKNYPDIKLFILLIDERPEEVTDMKRQVPEAEVVASTFDETPDKHCQVSEMVLEKAKRLVENKHDVVIILDSITRLSRAYNLVVPASGKVLTGGVDSNALHKPKRFFGAARNIEEGGSLTIIASALVDTGSKMDDYIYEEFKGTGNMELHLDRKLANRRLFPAIDIDSSSTRREDLLLTEEEKNKMWALRKYMQSQGIDEDQLIETVIDKMNSTKDNAEFLKLLNS